MQQHYNYKHLFVAETKIKNVDNRERERDREREEGRKSTESNH